MIEEAFQASGAARMASDAQVHADGQHLGLFVPSRSISSKASLAYVKKSSLVPKIARVYLVFVDAQRVGHHKM